jgi:hypothetical protein
MERKYEIGQHVKYVDPYGVARDALVTIWWGDVESYRSGAGEPGCNVVFVSNDPKANDQYGRQLEERVTSVIHKSAQPAHGNYWCWPEEV